MKTLLLAAALTLGMILPTYAQESVCTSQEEVVALYEAIPPAGIATVSVYQGAEYEAIVQVLDSIGKAPPQESDTFLILDQPGTSNAAIVQMYQGCEVGSVSWPDEFFDQLLTEALGQPA